MVNFLGYHWGLQWYDFMRIATTVLALAALYGSSRRANRFWLSYTNRLRRLWWAFNGLLILLAEASIEQIVLHNAWGPRVLFSFLFALVSVSAVYMDEGYIKSEDHPHG